MASSLAYVAGDVAFNPFGDLDFLLLDLKLAGLGGSSSWDSALPFFNTRLALPSPTQKLGRSNHFH